MVQGESGDKPIGKLERAKAGIKALPKHVELRYMGGEYVYTSRRRT